MKTAKKIIEIEVEKFYTDEGVHTCYASREFNSEMCKFYDYDDEIGEICTVTNRRIRKENGISIPVANCPLK